MSQPLSLCEHDKTPCLSPDLKHFSQMPRHFLTGKLETHFPGFPGSGWLRTQIIDPEHMHGHTDRAPFIGTLHINC